MNMTVWLVYDPTTKSYWSRMPNGREEYQQESAYWLIFSQKHLADIACRRERIYDRLKIVKAECISAWRAPSYSMCRCATWLKTIVPASERFTRGKHERR